MFPDVGGELGPYEILGELGGGGVARVYRAWDERLHREVAIKLLDERLATMAARKRFLREARAASGLNHPNICTIFDVGEHEGVPYLAMELLEGEPLTKRISRNAISVDEILRHGAEISDALAAAHARGIVHGKITPANIFLVRKPIGSAQAKVLDFGLAKIEEYANPERDVLSQLPGMGVTAGAASYLSPEQARGELLDARSDLFSLGVVMYEMATGRLPFRGNTSALVFVQLLGQMAPEPVRSLNPQVPAELEQIIMKLLAKSPRARFQSATELTDELQELAEQRSGWLTRVKKRMAAVSVPSDASARPGRNSIATEPRVSFPATAPYPGQSGLQRAAIAGQERNDSSTTTNRGTGEATKSRSALGFRGLRPMDPGPALHGAHPGADGSTTGESRRVAWWRLALVIALAVALIAFLGGVLAWKLGWTGALAR